MKQIEFACLTLIFTFQLQAQPGVEPVSRIDYYGSFSEIAVQGDYAYVLNEYGMLSLDLTDPAHPDVLQQFPIEEDPYFIVDTEIYDNVLYVYGRAPYRFDISNPRDINTLPQISFRIKTSQARIGDYLYAATQLGKFYTVDISDADNPAILDSVTVRYTRVHRLMAQDSLLIGQDRGSGLLSFNFFSTDRPDGIRLVGQFRSEEYRESYYERKPVIIGNLIYAITNSNASYFLSCIDFSDPTEPFMRFEWEIEPALEVGVAYGLLALLERREGEMALNFYSNENPDTLILASNFPFPVPVEELLAIDSMMYMASPIGLEIYYTRNLQDARHVGRFRSRTCAGLMVKTGNYLTTSLNDSTFRTISVADPENPHEVSQFRNDNLQFISDKWVNLEGLEFIIGIEYPFRLVILELDENGDLSFVSDIDITPLDHQDFFSSETDISTWEGGLVAMVSAFRWEDLGSYNYFYVISLEDPENPNVTATLIEHFEDAAGFSNQVLVSGNYAYIPEFMWMGEGSYVISIHDPTEPRIVAYEQRHPFRFPIAIENELMIANNEVYSLADPANPVSVGYLDRNEAYANDVVIQHGLVAIDSWRNEGNFSLYNVRDPENPFLITSLSLPENPLETIFDNGLFYIRGSSGIQILRYTGQDDVIDIEASVPADLQLKGPFPNPFNSTTRLTYETKFDSEVTLTLTDVSGREIEVIYHGYKKAGSYEISINAADLYSGVFFARFESRGETRTVKLVCIK